MNVGYRAWAWIQTRPVVTPIVALGLVPSVVVPLARVPLVSTDDLVLCRSIQECGVGPIEPGCPILHTICICASQRGSNCRRTLSGLSRTNVEPHCQLDACIDLSCIMAGGLVKYRHLSRKSSHRRALLRNLVTSLIEHESISTTWPKAKEAQRIAEKMISHGKKNTEASKRQVLKFMFVRQVMRKTIYIASAK